MTLESATRSDLEVTILDNNDLYVKFDEERLMSGGYTDEEYRVIILDWMVERDETFKF